MAAIAHDDMVVHGNTQGRCDVDDGFGHLDVGLWGRRVAARVVVHQDQCGRGSFQRALDHLARIDRGVVDGADLLYLVGDEWFFLSRNRRRNCSLSVNAMLERQ
jgi:hypothetical protein